MDSTPIARHLVVHGLVQAVGFRWSMAREAGRQGVHGWVRNTAAGDVEALVEGAPAAVDALVAWAHRGPSHARVTHVEVTAVEPRGVGGFEIEP